MYHIMLIITDGDIHDIRASVDNLVELSNYAVSLIVVGVGDGNFKSLEYLDSDNRMLKDSKNIEAKRDILQFVPLNQFKQTDEFGKVVIVGEALAEAVLKEVPD